MHIIGDIYANEIHTEYSPGILNSVRSTIESAHRSDAVLSPRVTLDYIVEYPSDSNKWGPAFHWPDRRQTETVHQVDDLS